MSCIGIATCLEANLEAEIIQDITQDSLPLQVVRRCRDLTELLAAAQAGMVQMVVVDSEIIELDTAALTALSTAEVSVLVFAPLEDEDEFSHLGMVTVELKSDPRLPEVEQSDSQRLLKLIMSLLMPPPPPLEDAAVQVPQPSVTNGKIIALWGPPGSPGKSSLAVNLAAGLRTYGTVLLVDADTVEPSLVQMLGVSLETSGVITGCRLAEQGHLNEESFSTIVTRVGARVDLLTGMSKAERWREIGESSLAKLLEWAKSRYSWVLVDLASGSEDPEDFFANVGPSRYGAQAGAFSVADLVIEVGLPDPVGMRRLVVSHDQAIRRSLWACPALVVVNRARSSVAGSRPEKSVQEVMSQAIPGVPVVVVREAQEDLDRALVAGCDVETVNPEALVLDDFRTLLNEILRFFEMLPSRTSTRRKGRGANPLGRNLPLGLLGKVKP